MSFLYYITFFRSSCEGDAQTTASASDPRMPSSLQALKATSGASFPISSSTGSATSDNALPGALPQVEGGTFKFEALSAATEGFSDANLLGQGGFGKVYLGTLNGQDVAIKKLIAGGRQGEREFRAEVEIISRVHHRNLVSLVGYCIYGEQRLLVYEYVPNKTLQFHLHGSGRGTLDWPRRWKIALGAAKGLAYLHEDCHPKIIHRDIKAANILLDYNFEPKVADFGLARYQTAEDTHVSTRVMGTWGYLAPEYANTGQLTDRSDVFSFGVVLLELITGKKPILPREAPGEEQSFLVNWVRPMLTQALDEGYYDDIVDPKLENNYDAHDMERLIQCAAAAVRQTARSRPRMIQIARFLEGDMSLEDLIGGIAPRKSTVQQGGRGTSEHVRDIRRMAFENPDYTTGGSEYSEPTSEYGLDLSTSTATGETEIRGSSKLSDPRSRRTFK